MAVLIDSTNNGSLAIPGEYNRGIGQYSMRMPAPQVATGATLFPGLFAGIVTDATNATQVTSIDQVSTPTVANVVGVVARQKVAQGGLVTYANIAANALPVGYVMDLLQVATGYVWVWVGSAITSATKVYIAPTTTGGVVAGSVVPSTYTNAIDISTIATFAPINGSTFSFAQGDLVAVCLKNPNTF